MPVGVGVEFGGEGSYTGEAEAPLGLGASCWGLCGWWLLGHWVEP